MRAKVNLNDRNDVQTTIIRKFIGCLIKRGNKVRAHNIFMAVNDIVSARLEENPLVVIYVSLSSIRPLVSLLSKKVGGSTYKLPYLITKEHGLSLAGHWLIENSKKRHDKTFIERLANELIETYLGRNTTLEKRRDEIHRTATSNRPFMHYRHRYRRRIKRRWKKVKRKKRS